MVIRSIHQFLVVAGSLAQTSLKVIALTVVLVAAAICERALVLS